MEYNLPDMSVLQAIRINSAQMAENNLRNHKDDCFLRTMCAVGTSDENIPEMTIGSGIQNFRSILDKVVKDIKVAGLNPETFPSINRALASHTLGRNTKDLSICDRIFPCASGKSAKDLLDRAVSGVLRESRATCQAAGSFCPGISIGCALCGMFSPGTCGNQCVIAGLYCGVSAYACKYEAESDMDTMTNEDIATTITDATTPEVNPDQTPTK